MADHPRSFFKKLPKNGRVQWLDDKVMRETEMKWQPLSEVQLWEEITQAERRMTPAQARLWEAIRVDPRKWAQSPYGNKGGGFWAVALLGQQVVWYNDIENGFNISRYEILGKIGEYWCNQDRLEEIIQSLLNLIEVGYGLSKSGPPIPYVRNPG